MRCDLIVDLTECTEFGQALRARTPRIVHGTAILLVLLLVVASAWMALTRANLVVRAAGRVRPLSAPEDTTDDFSDELSCEVGGRVVEVCVAEGDQVQQGDVLMRQDTMRLENQIAKLSRKIEAAEEELAQLGQVEQLLAKQFESAKGKAEAELAEVEEELTLARQRQAAEIRLAELDVVKAEDKERRLQKLATRNATTQEALFVAVTATQEASAKLRKVELPVDQGRVAVLQSAVDVVRQEFAVKGKELEIKQRAKQGEVEAAKLELANFELDRDRAVIRAPTDGVITLVETKAGDIVEPGNVGISMAKLSGFQFEVAIPNADIAHLRAGLPVQIRFDAYDHQQYGTLKGEVTAISPDSEVTNGPAGTQLALYKVKIAILEDELSKGKHRGPIKLGMTGQAEIVTDQESLLGLLVKQIRQSISLG